MLRGVAIGLGALSSTSVHSAKSHVVPCSLMGSQFDRKRATANLQRPFFFSAHQVSCCPIESRGLGHQFYSQLLRQHVG